MAEIKMPDKEPKRKIESHVHKAVTSGKVEEKSKLQKAAALFFEEDMDSIKGSIMDGYIKPKANEFMKDSIRKVKEFIVDNITGAAEIIFFGSTKKRGNGSGWYNGSKVNYVSYYNGGYDYDGGYRSEPKHEMDRDPNTHLKRIVISSYGKAQEVLGELIGFTKRYSVATVGDYYQLVDLTPTNIDFGYGWFDLVSVQIVKVSGGYMIDLPKPVPLD